MQTSSPRDHTQAMLRLRLQLQRYRQINELLDRLDAESSAGESPSSVMQSVTLAFTEALAQHAALLHYFNATADRNTERDHDIRIAVEQYAALLEQTVQRLKNLEQRLKQQRDALHPQVDAHLLRLRATQAYQTTQQQLCPAPAI